ncbi:hypothetical protein N7495_006545 [Penicillium taxi]|uniref:uncharacterized protein n=1 Tax=Penicillium taxi TaxID=168475 RepID=UPI002545A753|nr:uncharacterized protein N7495_006545 [Penicillium taxi]KAJ5894854.1 hypothetical protein N7495_006545 [Penicillium taxi]
MEPTIERQTSHPTAINLIPVSVPDELAIPNEKEFDSQDETSPPELKYELVTWNGNDDPENPQNWPEHSKILRSSAPLSIVFCIAFASSIFGSSASVTASEYGVSVEIMSLGVALFIAGFAVGPLLFAPMAELMGSAVVLVVSLIGCAIFQIPLALARNVATILICRFLAGTFGAGGLAVGSGILADVFGPITRGAAVGVAATTMNFGSIVGPIAGAFIVDQIGWRWTAWVTLMLFGAVSILCIFLLKESSHNRILMQRAARLRRETGNNNLRASAEMISQDPVVLFQKYFTKPVRMFCQEPILIVITIYLTLVYGSLYLSYQLFPKAFEKRGWSTSIASLPFIAVGLGLLSACGIFALFTMTWYKRRWVAAHRSIGEESEKSEPGIGIQPEDRLPPMILGAVLLPPSLIWFGWSGGAPWIVQVIPCFFIGFSLQIIFVSGIVYIVDVYLTNTVSAISIHVMVRSLVSATFPMFEGPMYDTLNIDYSATLLAGLSALIMVSPILLRIYGPRIRSLSRFSG